MKHQLVNTPFLSSQQIGELASKLDTNHRQMLKLIDGFNAAIKVKRLEISTRWQSNSYIGMEQRSHAAQSETREAILAIKNKAEETLDTVFKDAGATYHQIQPQKQFYDSPVKVLARQGLGSVERSQYLEQLDSSGPIEIANLGQFAVSTNNVMLATAVLSKLDSMPSKDRPFGQLELAKAMHLDEFEKTDQYLKIAEARFQGLTLAYRAFRTGQVNPINTLSIGLRMKGIDETVMKSLEAQNA